MLDSEGNAILVAQNKIGAATPEVTDLSGNSKPANIAFSAELSRARDSISDQTTDVDQKIITSAEIENPVEKKLMDFVTGDTDGTSLISKPVLGSSTAPLLNHSSTPDVTDDLQTTRLGVKIVQATNTPTNALATAIPEIDLAESKQVQALNNSIDRLSSLRNEIESSSPYGIQPSSSVSESNLQNGLKTASVVSAVLQSPLRENSQNSQNSLNEIMLAQNGNVALKTVPKTLPATIIPVDLSARVAPEPNLAVQLLNSVAEKDNPVERPVTVSAEIKKAPEIIERPIINTTTVFTETNEFAKAGTQGTDIKAEGNQVANVTMLYKPSPGLIKSGLGRTSIELNSGVNSITQVIKPTVSSPPVLINPLLSASAGSSSIAEAIPDKVVIAPGSDQLRSVGSLKTVPTDGSLSGTKRATGAVANLDESKQSVSFQAVNNSGSVVGLTNTPPQITLSELAIPKGSVNTVETPDASSINTDTKSKIISTTNYNDTDLGSNDSKNPHQPFAQGAATTVDEDAALTQLRESVAVEQHNKFSNVTPGISLRQAVKLEQSPNIVSLQSLSGPAELTSSNVYHATSSGIITAPSTPLNTGLAADLASAPRTVLLDQSGADESLVDNLRWVVNEKLSRATINVSPANLGPITVSVDVENQNMSVSIIANSAVAKDAIDSLLPRMREHFGNEGYQQVSVDVSSQQERQGDLRNQPGYLSEHERGSESDSNDEELVHEENKTSYDDQKNSNSLIDTYA